MYMKRVITIVRERMSPGRKYIKEMYKMCKLEHIKRFSYQRCEEK